MITLWKQALGVLCLAAALAAPAQADLIDFESASPGTFLFSGTTFTEGGINIELNGDFGVIDTVAAFGSGANLLDLAPPRGNDTKFLSVLNDSFLVVSAGNGQSFRLAGMQFGYIAPLTGLFAPGESAGLLLAEYLAADGSLGLQTWDFGQADANGEFGFLSVGLGGMGALAGGVQAVAFAACAYDGSGGCLINSGGLSQFAIDNLVVPEPASLPLALAAFGLALAMRGSRRAFGTTPTA